VKTYNVVVRSSAQQTTERDDWSEAGKVHEEESGNTLDMKSVLVVAHVPLGFQLHVVNQTSKQSADRINNNIKIYAYFSLHTAMDHKCRRPNLTQDGSIDCNH